MEKPACLLHELKDYLRAIAIGAIAAIADPLTSCVSLSLKRAENCEACVVDLDLRYLFHGLIGQML